MATLYSRMRAQACKHAGRSAVIEKERVYTYRWLLGAVDALGSRLSQAGAERGARVALILPNGVEFVVAFFAFARIGGVVVPINPALREPEIASILEDAKVTAVVTSNVLLARFGATVRSGGGLGEDSLIVMEAGDLAGDAVGGAAVGSAEGASPHDPVLQLYSSGSTGRPKRVERSHFNLLYETDRLVAALQFTPTDRLLGVAPFSHVNGLMRSMVASVLAGATLVPLSQFERREVGQVIEEQGITVFIGVPFMFAMLAETRWPRPVDFSSLRLCISSSAPLRREISERFYEKYGLYVRQLYGTTETGTIAVNVSPDPGEAVDSVGTALEGVEVEIFSEDRRMLRPGDVGEIGIRSPAAAREYPGTPDQTKVAFWNGYFFPGDIGRKDTMGRVYLVGRKSLFINRGGYKVNPYEIEEALERHPKVRDVAVVGVDTVYGDQKIKAVVVTSAACTEGEIIEFCRESLADFKVPSIVEFRAELPKSSAGKILRRAL